MGVAEILASIDREIAQLKQARALLASNSSTSGTKAGALKGPVIKAVAARPAKRKKRTLTPEGRKRIAEAQKKRWEAHKKASASTQK